MKNATKWVEDWVIAELTHWKVIGVDVRQAATWLAVDILRKLNPTEREVALAIATAEWPRLVEEVLLDFPHYA